MRRTLVRLATATLAVLGVALVTAGPALASADEVAPPPSTTSERDCGFTSVCWPGQHQGWVNPPRNVGG
jgi:hypothetical protein